MSSGMSSVRLLPGAAGPRRDAGVHSEQVRQVLHFLAQALQLPAQFRVAPLQILGFLTETHGALLLAVAALGSGDLVALPSLAPLLLVLLGEPCPYLLGAGGLEVWRDVPQAQGFPALADGELEAVLDEH